MEHEYAFEMAASNLRFGAGVTREIGMDLIDLGARRVMVVTDQNLAKLAPVARDREARDGGGLAAPTLPPLLDENLEATEASWPSESRGRDP